MLGQAHTAHAQLYVVHGQNSPIRTLRRQLRPARAGLRVGPCDSLLRRQPNCQSASTTRSATLIPLPSADCQNAMVSVCHEHERVHNGR